VVTAEILQVIFPTACHCPALLLETVPPEAIVAAAAAAVSMPAPPPMQVQAASQVQVRHMQHNISVMLSIVVQSIIELKLIIQSPSFMPSHE
jgi:hypothetical protein